MILATPCLTDREDASLAHERPEKKFAVTDGFGAIRHSIEGSRGVGEGAHHQAIPRREGLVVACRPDA